MSKPTLQEATNKLREALALVREAADDHVKEYSSNLSELNRLIRTNKSEWGGDATCVNNIVEAAVRNAGFEELERQIRRLPAS